MNLPSIIFIAGGGHSGSTLFDLIIGSSSNVFGLGEVSFFNSYNRNSEDPKLYSINTKKCSCGREFKDCWFWNRVKKYAGKELDIPRNYTFIETVKASWNIICPVSSLRFNLSNHDDEKLFKAVSKVRDENQEKTDFLVDSSKDPRRLLKLESLLSNEKLKVIFLVRDIRGYVNSYSNPKKWRVKDAGLQPQNFLRVAFRWLAVNLSLKVFLALHDIDSINVVYDQFCQNPEQSLARIRETWGVDIPEDYINSIRETEYHNIHGNLLKFSEIEKVRWDRSWENQLPGWKINTINLLFGWANYWFVLSKLKLN
jgi:hypothetical protein